jgi:hypothetical protein
MSQVQLATRVDRKVKEAVEAYCASQGLKMNRFIQDALLDRLEELQDSEDIKTLRGEPSRPLAELVAELGLDGDL